VRSHRTNRIAFVCDGWRCRAGRNAAG
jgi:hypothetical protein